MPRIPQHLIDADARRVRPDRPEPEVRYSADDARSGSGRRFVPAANEKQMKFLLDLIRERNFFDLKGAALSTCEALYAGQYRIVTGPDASRLIDELLKCPRSDSAPATPGQIRLIRSLAAEMNMNPGDKLDDMTFGTATRLIDKLKAAKVAAREGAQRQKVSQDGMYRTADGSIYKVQVAVHGSGMLYAKKLVEMSDGTWEFVRDMTGMSKLRPEMRMTLEEAQEFGRLYGICVRCGATLTDEESIEYGIGPICRSKI